jgi:hypothetical protein
MIRAARGRPGPSHRITAAMPCPAPSQLLAVVAVVHGEAQEANRIGKAGTPGESTQGPRRSTGQSGTAAFAVLGTGHLAMRSAREQMERERESRRKQRGLEAERKRFKRRAPYLEFDPIERLDKLYAEINAIPLSERRKRAAQKDEWGEEIELGNGDHKIDDLVSEIRDFTRETEPDNQNAQAPPDDQPDPAKERRGYRTYPGRRPKGRHEALVKEMIAEFAERFAIRLKANDVKSRWKKYRRDLGITHRRPKD